MPVLGRLPRPPDEARRVQAVGDPSRLRLHLPVPQAFELAGDLPVEPTAVLRGQEEGFPGHDERPELGGEPGEQHPEGGREFGLQHPPQREETTRLPG